VTSGTTTPTHAVLPREVVDSLFPDDLPEVGHWESLYPPRGLPAQAHVTRFAPSPTGYVHIGGIYTAMICQAVSHQSHGVYITRVEDTDAAREVEGALAQFARAFEYFDLHPDETDPLVEPASSNLSTFTLGGGKLIFFHGDSDPWFSPLDTLGYYKSLATTNGGAENVAKWSRMFLIPGMAHCGGGPALDRFDMLSAIVNWVEKGTAPDSVIATGQAFPGRSRPLCPYPTHAHYKGTGDTQDAHNFQCQ